MTSPGTRLDPVIILGIANAHRETAGDIEGQRQKFNQAVESLEASCSGEMIVALRNAQERWEKELTDTIGDLKVMADNVEHGVNDLTMQDDTNKGKVDQIGVGILSDL